MLPVLMFRLPFSNPDTLDVYSETSVTVRQCTFLSSVHIEVVFVGWYTALKYNICNLSRVMWTLLSDGKNLHLQMRSKFIS